MSILSFNNWRNSIYLKESNLSLSGDAQYTIESRPNYVYSISKDKKYWLYQKNKTTTWHYVENEGSVAELNSKYNKKLAVYTQPGHDKFTLPNRSNYYYRIDSSNKYWEYNKIGTSSWKKVENKESVKSLNIKYAKSLSVYDPDLNKLVFSSKSDKTNFNMAKVYISRNSDKQKEVAEAIHKAGSHLGLNSNAIAALLGNVGRENNLRWSKITSVHSDPKNHAVNFGIVSWQGSRRKNLIDQLQKAKVYSNGKITGGIYKTILEMIKFIKTEMGESKFDSFKNSQSTKEASDILYRYIKYSMGKYNKHDKYFHAWKNHMWAKAAKDLDIIDYSYS